MNAPFQSSSRPVRFAGIALSLAVSLSGIGALVMPAVSVAATAVAVDQQPLTIQPTIPPDIMLMLDDSGSMNWDVMPDWSYLPAPGWGNGSGWNEFNDAFVLPLIYSGVNGLYYNPTVTYTLPPLADGSGTYPQAKFDAAQVNGFDSGSSPTTVELATYRGMYDSNNVDYRASSVQYSIAVAKTGATAYTPDGSCPSGWGNSGKYPGYCSRQYGNQQTSGDYYPSSIPFSFYDTANDFYYVSRCSSDRLNDVYDYNGGLSSDRCYPGISFFTYATANTSGGYVRHYVNNVTGACAAVGLTTNCVDASTVDGVTDATQAAAIRNNIANWFSYYHTRILMAKSGMMVGFSALSPKYRFGYGDIHNGIKANVAPFGNGTTGTPKANFWDWVANKAASGGTPLQAALKTVGSYYQSAQPWNSMAGDPGYSGSATPQLACRAAYTIMTTDGFWNGGTPSGIGNADGNAGTKVTGPNGQSYTYSPAAPYSGGDPSTATDPSLADVAQYYWETDLQPTLSNEVPTSTEDPAFWQHMTTFTMGMGFTPVNIAPAGTTIDQIFNWANGGTAIPGFSWPTPAADSINNIADLAHAAVNGHGAFFSVTSPQGFAASIQSALKRVAERVGSGASLAANSTQLKTGTFIYQANYFTAKWKGELKALAIDAVTGVPSTAPTWQASQQIPAAGSRTIETWNGTSFVAFKNGTSTPPSLSSAQLAALGADATAQQAMVNYLRGDASGEQKNGGTFRDRDTPLGDVVDSQPVFSGAPNPNEFINQNFFGTMATGTPATVPFYDWAVGATNASGVFTPSAASKRNALIFVASNDGMLHAFNAGTYHPEDTSTTPTTPAYVDSGTGAEVYAYMPGAVITAGVKNLSDPAYGDSTDPHQYYNDGQLTIADAYVKLAQTGDSSPQWHTILVGTTGRGLAKAIYALDVTNPSSITPLWERSAGDGKSGSDYIGQMAGKPVIAQTNYQPAVGATPASSTWSVLMGNGYNSAKGTSALLQFDLGTGALSVHTTTDSTTGNGLAGPVVWMDNPANGVGDIAYAGDLHGHVWSFALNDTTGSNPNTTSTGALLFTAKDSGGTAQPITAGMLAGRNPKTGDVWLFFGTGEYLSVADLSNTKTQTWYGIIVQSSTASLVTNLSSGRSALTARTITSQSTGSGTTLPGRTVSTQVTNVDGTTDMTGKSGWYMDLLAPVGPSNAPVQQGERMVDTSEFQGNLLIGVTRIPLVTDVCNPSGSGWIMALDPFTGAPPTNDFFDLNGDGYVNSSDRVGGAVAAGVGFASLPNAPIFVGAIMETSFDNGTISSLKTAGSGGSIQRVNWRELVNP